MWQRFRRAMRSFFGAFVSSMENPELILEQNIRDMNDQIPRINESIAMVKANQTLLEKENTQFRNEIASLKAKVKAAIQHDREDIAGTYALQLQTLEQHLVRNEQQLEAAKAAYQKAVAVKEAFMREKERKSREAMEAIRDARRAQWQSKVADAMESFQVAGIDATHDEMLRKVQEKSAINEARMEMALGNVDTTSAKIEEEAEKLRAAELVRQMKLEMGLTESAPATSESEAEKTIGRRAEIKT